MKILSIKTVNILSTNGDDINTVEILKELKSLGHKVSILSTALNFEYEESLKIIKTWKNRYKLNAENKNKVNFEFYGIDTNILFEDFYKFNIEIEKFIFEYKPDIIFSNFWDLSLLKFLQKNNIKYLSFVSDHTFSTDKKHLLNDGINIIENVKNVVTFSNYTKIKLKEVWNKNSFLKYPTINESLYKVDKNRKEYITLINPVKPKGLDLFISLAEKLPRYLFVGLGGWNEELVKVYKEKCKTSPNLKYLKATDDMKQIYSKTKILLVPSIWEESFGRVCIEAMLNGIPVITSQKGGLLEAVPYSQFNLDTEDLEKWISLIKKLDDENYYNEVSKKMLEFSKEYIKNQKLSIPIFEKYLISLI